MYSFQLPVRSANRDGSAVGLLLFTHLEVDSSTTRQITPGISSRLLQDYYLNYIDNFMPIIPIINSEPTSHHDVEDARIQSVNWPSFITGGRMEGPAHPDGPTHYRTIFREKWKNPSFLGCYIENFSLSGEVDRDILERMQLCIGRVTVESGLLTVESDGLHAAPRSVLQR